MFDQIIAIVLLVVLSTIMSICAHILLTLTSCCESKHKHLNLLDGNNYKDRAYSTRIAIGGAQRIGYLIGALTSY